MLFLGIILWKGASPFNGGRGCFSDEGASFLSKRVPHGGFDGGGFRKKSLDGWKVPPTLENPACI